MENLEDIVPAGVQSKVESYSERVARVFGSLKDYHTGEKSTPMLTSEYARLESADHHGSCSSADQMHGYRHHPKDEHQEAPSCDKYSDGKSKSKHSRQSCARHDVSIRVARRRVSATPDYVKHPDKWAKYDLKEDGTEKLIGMAADQQNKAAAFEFLQQMRARPAESVNCEAGNEPDAGPTGKIMFKKPMRRMQKKKEGGDDFCQASSKASPVLCIQKKLTDDSVHVMPKYEVGVKRERKLKRDCSVLESGGDSVKVTKLENSSVKLTHLHVEDIDD